MGDTPPKFGESGWGVSHTARKEVDGVRREKEGRKGNRRGERERKRGVRGKREREIEREGDRERGR